MNLEQFLLCKLSEEASEITKLALKAQQFGLNSDYIGKTNRELIHGELDDLAAAVTMLNEHLDFGYIPNFWEQSQKENKVVRYLKFSIEAGKVGPSAMKIIKQANRGDQ